MTKPMGFEMPQPCPFNSVFYTSGLSSIGAPEPHHSGRLSLLRRPIEGTALFDGMGSWPYQWIDGPEDIDCLYEDFRHLVSVTVVTQPGYVPRGRGEDAVLLKQHYVYDPALPAPALSARAQARLNRCADIATFECATDSARCARMTEMYEQLMIRRGLRGSYVDFPARHFEVIDTLPCGLFFQVRGDVGVGAMCCGVRFGDMLQILHTASSPEGLRWDASYLLMAGLQAYARENGVRLLTGGMPSGGSEGLRIFKQRWSNRFEPAYLLRIVNNPAQYAALSAANASATSFFPAYRAPV
jgi:hypothetical protein